MPKIDRKLIAKKANIVSDLKKIIKNENILHEDDETRPSQVLDQNQILEYSFFQVPGSLCEENDMMEVFQMRLKCTFDQCQFLCNHVN